MKKLIKRMIRMIIPARGINLIKGVVLFWPDIRRYALYSNTFFRLDSPGKDDGYMTLLYHILEKGLTMPETRLGFGNKIAKELTEVCSSFLDSGYDKSDLIFIHSVEVLNEYVRYHNERNFALDPETVSCIRELSARSGIETTARQLRFTYNEYFSQSGSSFDMLCRTRHTARNFTQVEVPLDKVTKSIEMAGFSPSDCNRQPVRVVVIRNQDRIKEVLELQNGNRGFGHLITTMLVVTSDLSVFQGNERNEPFLNAGMFSMSLLYALHYHKVGACLLNWAATGENDRKLRHLIDVPENELITLLIGCGNVPEEIEIAASPRKPVDAIMRVIG